MSRSSLLLLLVVVVAASTGLGQALPSCFMSMGDWGGVNDHVSSMSSQMQTIIQNPAIVGCSNITFLFALGDNFYPTGVTSIEDPQWQRVFVNQFRSQPGFAAMPVYSVVGDHDYNQLNPSQKPNATRAMAQVEYSQKVDPLWILPDTNYSFTQDFGQGRRVLFIVLDTEAMYTCLRLKAEWCFKKGQDEWLEGLLSAADNDATITAAVVVGHHAVVCPLGGHYDPFIDAVLVPIGRNHRVSMFLTAHSHFVAWSQESDLSGGGFEKGEMWYVINGAGRGAGAYDCYWHGLTHLHAKPVDQLCFPAAFNDAGGFMVHRVRESGFDHCVVASMNGTIVRCQSAPYRASSSAGSSSDSSA